MNKKTILISVVVVGILVAVGSIFLTQGDLFQGRLSKDIKVTTRPQVNTPATEYSPITLTLELDKNKEYLVRLYWVDPNPKAVNQGQNYKIYRSNSTPVQFTSQNLIGTANGINFNDFPSEIGTYYYAIEIDAPGATASRSNEVSNTLTQAIKWGPAIPSED